MLGWLGLNKYLLIGAAVAIIAAFGAGWFFAKGNSEDKLIAAQLEYYDKGIAAQRKFDGAQFVANQVDFDRRFKVLQAQKQRVITIEKEVEKLVPRVDACMVSPEAMKRLNDVVE